MFLNQEGSLLFIIDVQEKLLNAIFNKDLVLKNAKILAKAANILSLPIVVTEQYPQGLGESIEGLKENATVFEKVAFNALNDESLLDELKMYGKNQIIILGIETHICVYQTAVALLNNGFNVTVASDACGSRSEYEYNVALANLKDYGAKIKTTEMVLFELLKTAKHPNFKEIQALIK